MKEKDMRNEKTKRGIAKKVSTLMGTVMLTTMCWGNVAFAGNSYLQNLYEGFLKENLLWGAIIATVIAVIVCSAKKNHIGIVISLITGAIASFLVMSPEKIKDVGIFIGNAIGL